MGERRVVLTEDGAGGIQSSLIHGRFADEPLGVGKGDAGRGEALALVVGDDLAAVAPPHGHAGVGRAEVDADRRAAALQLRAVRHLPTRVCAGERSSSSSTTLPPRGTEEVSN